METSSTPASKQAALRNDTPPFSSSSHLEEEKSKAPNQVSAPAVPTPDVGQKQEQVGRMSERDELFKRQFVMPQYLRVAMAAAVESKLFNDMGSNASSRQSPPEAPKFPLIVMINSKSGGRQGPRFRSVLSDLLSKEQVFDLAVTPPNDFFRYGLGCLEKLAESGDQCAKDCRNQLRVLVGGGDGTVGWVLGSMTELNVEGRTPIPPVGVIPLGTGNDLSRSFGWGGSFMFAWRPIVRRYLSKAGGSETCELDSWQVMVRTSTKEKVNFPHALRPQQHMPLPAEGDSNGSSSDVKAASFEGVFYNYFSIGMDAQVAYGFHHLRERRPYLARGPFSNKLVYSSCGCAQGWFCTPCSTNPRVRGLNNIMRLYIRREVSGGWESIDLPHNIRAVIMLNLQSYASGRNPWGHPKDEYNETKHFVQPSPNDGLLELFGLFDGWHTSLVMLSLRSAKRLAQACAIRMELIADQRHRVYMQMDGEPWRQPLSEDENSTAIEITQVPTHSKMLRPK